MVQKCADDVGVQERCVGREVQKVCRCAGVHVQDRHQDRQDRQVVQDMQERCVGRVVQKCADGVGV